MIIYTIWVSECDGWEGAYLLTAWDEYTIDANYEGWEEAIAEAKSKHSDVWVIRIRVPQGTLDLAANPPAVDAEVIEGGQ